MRTDRKGAKKEREIFKAVPLVNIFSLLSQIPKWPKAELLPSHPRFRNPNAWLATGAGAPPSVRFDIFRGCEAETRRQKEFQMVWRNQRVPWKGPFRLLQLGPLLPSASLPRFFFLPSFHCYSCHGALSLLPLVIIRTTPAVHAVDPGTSFPLAGGQRDPTFQKRWGVQSYAWTSMKVLFSGGTLRLEPTQGPRYSLSLWFIWRAKINSVLLWVHVRHPYDYDQHSAKLFISLFESALSLSLSPRPSVSWFI